MAGICHEIGLIEEIDAALVPTGRQVSMGQTLQAMVLNVLGFTSRAMYLSAEFFQNRPVAALIGEGITAEMFSDDSLGDALDRVYAYGVTGCLPGWPVGAAVGSCSTWRGLDVS